MPSLRFSTFTWSPRGVSIYSLSISDYRWLRLHHESAPVTRIHSDPHGPLFIAFIRCIFDVLRPWNTSINANSLCRIHASSHLRTHGSPRFLSLRPQILIPGIFGLLQLIAFTQFIRSLLPSKTFTLLLRVFIITIFLVSLASLIALTFSGTIAPWTGRFYSLWDTGYAKIHIPIIASVSEHQPTPWPSYFFDLSWLIWLFPGGVYLCFRRLRDEHVFVIVYAVMVRPWLCGLEVDLGFVF